MRTFSFHRASSPTDAVHRLQQDQDTILVAGGTTVVDLVKLDVMRPAQLVDVNRLGLDTIEHVAHEGIRIGANVRNSTLAWDPEIRSRFPVLAEAILAGASAQIRNMATTAGNLRQRTRCPYFRDTAWACNKRQPGSGCAALEGYNRSHAVLGGSDACIATHPSDLSVALVALDAIVLVQGPQGERRIPVREFHRLPAHTPEREDNLERDELIVGVILPALPAGARSLYVKVRDRQSYEFALASAAVAVRVQDGVIDVARIALGGVGTVPWRCSEAEARLLGAAPGPDVFREAAAAALREARPRRHNAFKIPLAQRVLIEALHRAISPDHGTASTRRSA